MEGRPGSAAGAAARMKRWHPVTAWSRPERDAAAAYLDRVRTCLDHLEVHLGALMAELVAAYERDAIVFVLGNGGSASAASHFAQDLVNGTVKGRTGVRRLRALALTDNISYITALANDEGYETVFEQQLATLARPGDVVIAISASGNSPNVLRAVDFARRGGLRTIALTGRDGQLWRRSNVAVRVPADEPGLVESVHAVLCHLLVSLARERLPFC